jgi:putative transposase
VSIISVKLNNLPHRSPARLRAPGCCLYPFRIEAWVVLPDHLRCIWTLPPGDGGFAVRWRLIKLLFCKELPREERLSAVRHRRKERGIRQRRYWEHTLRDEQDFQAHVDYVHINPVKHGLVERAADWPYSTFHRYVKAGILPDPPRRRVLSLYGWGTRIRT